MKKIELKKKDEKKPVVKKTTCPAGACQILQDMWESGKGAYDANSKYCKSCAKDFPDAKAICEERTIVMKKAKVKKSSGKSGVVKVGFGHKEGTQAAHLDSLLAKGSTKEQIIKSINDSGLNVNDREEKIMWARVLRHIDHLQREHGVKTTKDKNGSYKSK